MKLREFLADTLSVSKGSMKLNTKGVIEEYRERYEKLIGSGKAFRHDTYTVNPGGRVMVHIKVPSETVDRFFYDVLIELSAEKSAADFRDCDIKIFSNCPSFVYSVAYVFAHWDPDAPAKGGSSRKNAGMMIDTLRGKLPKERLLVPGSEKSLGHKPIHDKPVVRNPMGIPLFDKSVYFAIFYMLDNVQFSQAMHNYHNIPMTRLMATIDDFDSLMVKRKREETRQKAVAKAKDKATREAFEEHERNIDNVNKSGMKKPRSAIRVTSVQGMKGARGSKSPKSTRRTGK